MPCDQNIYNNGENIVIFKSLVKEERMEKWVQKIRDLSDNQQVDWHYIGGRAQVKALGDTERVRAVVRELIDKRQLPSSLM
jgi:uncharacterized pyridoxal phosphate-containing UPF0001 family protein